MAIGPDLLGGLVLRVRNAFAFVIIEAVENAIANVLRDVMGQEQTQTNHRNKEKPAETEHAGVAARGAASVVPCSKPALP